MAFSLAARHTPVAEMNITPLVDVMLVLLIIFMVTMPLRSLALRVDLPQAVPIPPPPPSSITLRVDAQGQVAWNGSVMPMTALDGAMKVEAARYASPKDQPLVRVDVDPGASYDSLAQVLAATQNAGMTKVGFVEPTTR